MCEHITEQARDVGAVRVVRREIRRADGEGAAQNGRCLGVARLRREQPAERELRVPHRRMILRNAGSEDGDGAADVGLRLGETPLEFLRLPRLEQRGGVVLVLRPVRAGVDRHRLALGRLGLGVPADLDQNRAVVAQGRREVRAVRLDAPAEEGQRLLVGAERVVVAAEAVVAGAEVALRHRDARVRRLVGLAIDGELTLHVGHCLGIASERVQHDGDVAVTGRDLDLVRRRGALQHGDGLPVQIECRLGVALPPPEGTEVGEGAPAFDFPPAERACRRDGEREDRVGGHEAVLLCPHVAQVALCLHDVGVARAVDPFAERERSAVLRLGLAQQPQLPVRLAERPVHRRRDVRLPGEGRVDRCRGVVEQARHAHVSALHGRVGRGQQTDEKVVYCDGLSLTDARLLRLPQRHARPGDERHHDHACRDRRDAVPSQKAACAVARRRRSRLDGQPVEVPPQVSREVGGRRVAPRGLFGECLGHDHVEVAAEGSGRPVWRHGARRRGRRLGDGALGLGRAQPIDADRAVPGEHLEQHQAEAVDVRRRRDRCARELLRRGVRRRERPRSARPRHAVVGVREELRDPEVEQLHARPLLGVLDQDVGRLEVAVDDRVQVRVRHGVARLQEQPEALCERERPGDVGDRHAVDEFHREVGRAVGREAAIQQARHAGMIEPGEQGALAQEARPEVGPEPGVDELQRGVLLEGGVVARGAVDGAHAAASEHARDAPRADGSGQRRVVETLEGRDEASFGLGCGERRHEARGLAAQDGVGRAVGRHAGSVEEDAARVGGQVERLGHEVFEARPGVGSVGHGSEMRGRPVPVKRSCMRSRGASERRRPASRRRRRFRRRGRRRAMPGRRSTGAEPSSARRRAPRRPRPPRGRRSSVARRRGRRRG